MDYNDLYLVFINKIGVDSEGNTEYIFYYSDTPDDVWAEDFPEQVPSACYIENLIPSEGTYNAIRKATSKTNINLIQDNSCFSFQDCIDGIIALAWVLDKDGNYYPLPYGTSVEESDKFFKKYSFEFDAIIEVDKDKKNGETDISDDNEYNDLEEDYGDEW